MRAMKDGRVKLRARKRWLWPPLGSEERHF